MKPPSSARPQKCLSRAEKVLAIQKAVREGSYEIDSVKVANKLVMHLLNLPSRRRSIDSNSLQLKPTILENACLSPHQGEILH